MPDCLAEHGSTCGERTLPRSAAYTDGVLEAAAPTLPAGVSLLDTSGYFCEELACPPLIGNVRVHLDGGHVTSTYMRTTAPLLEPDLLALTGW